MPHVLWIEAMEKSGNRTWRWLASGFSHLHSPLENVATTSAGKCYHPKWVRRCWNNPFLFLEPPVSGHRLQLYLLEFSFLNFVFSKQNHPPGKDIEVGNLQPGTFQFSKKMDDKIIKDHKNLSPAFEDTQMAAMHLRVWNEWPLGYLSKM